MIHGVKKTREEKRRKCVRGIRHGHILSSCLTLYPSSLTTKEDNMHFMIHIVKKRRRKEERKTKKRRCKRNPSRSHIVFLPHFLPIFFLLHFSRSRLGSGDVHSTWASDNTAGLEVSILGDAILHKFHKRNVWVWGPMEGWLSRPNIADGILIWGCKKENHSLVMRKGNSNRSSSVSRMWFFFFFFFSFRYSCDDEERVLGTLLFCIYVVSHQLSFDWFAV